MDLTKTDKPIDVRIEIWTWVGPRNHVLGGHRIPLREWPILGAACNGTNISTRVTAKCSSIVTDFISVRNVYNPISQATCNWSANDVSYHVSPQATKKDR